MRRQLAYFSHSLWREWKTALWEFQIKLQHYFFIINDKNNLHSCIYKHQSGEPGRSPNIAFCCKQPSEDDCARNVTRERLCPRYNPWRKWSNQRGLADRSAKSVNHALLMQFLNRGRRERWLKRGVLVRDSWIVVAQAPLLHSLEEQGKGGNIKESQTAHRRSDLRPTNCIPQTM